MRAEFFVPHERGPPTDKYCTLRECINEVKQDNHVVCSLIKSDYGRPANLLADLNVVEFITQKN